MRVSPMIPPTLVSDASESQTAVNKRRNMYIWLLLALLINFVSIFLAMWLGLKMGTLDTLEASMLAQSTANYGDSFDFEFAPLDPTIAAEVEADEEILRATGTAVAQTPVSIIPFPPTVTPSPTPNPTQTAASPSTASTAVPTRASSWTR